MKVIRKINDKIEEIQYPRKNITEPIEGEFKGEYYFIENIRESVNPEQYDFKIFEDVLTDEVHSEYYHLKICKRNWIKTEKSKEEIIQRLNDELGYYLDSEYPIWERTKHAGEGNYILLAMIEGVETQEQLDRKAYIDSLYSWITDCRIERKKREDNYLKNNKFPEFGNYESRPLT